MDGAFGIWAAASPAYAHLTRGYELADSWATDAHKWPNVTYDSGVALVREPRYLYESFALVTAYLKPGEAREPMHFTPESSRRARGVELWAALLSLGKTGMADLVDRCCSHARRFARGLEAAGLEEDAATSPEGEAEFADETSSALESSPDEKAAADESLKDEKQ